MVRSHAALAAHKPFALALRVSSFVSLSLSLLHNTSSTRSLSLSTTAYLSLAWRVVYFSSYAPAVLLPLLTPDRTTIVQ